jgi:uncharacterized protein (TIGR03435 family)
MSYLIALIICLTAFAQPSPSQTKSAEPNKAGSGAMSSPRFSISTVKPNNLNDGRWKMQFTADGYIARGVTLQQLIQDAYGIYDVDVFPGSPAWTKSKRYDLDAKVETGEESRFDSLDLDQQRQVLQALLAERFNLKTHYEEKPTQIYELIRATTGTKVKETSPDRILNTNMNGHVITSKPGQLVLEWTTMEGFAQLLSFQLGYPVRDKTGLGKRYDIQLTWAPDPSDGSIKENDSPDVALPSLFTALKEQLGLTLKANKGSKRVLVVDQIDLPTEN